MSSRTESKAAAATSNAGNTSAGTPAPAAAPAAAAAAVRVTYEADEENILDSGRPAWTLAIEGQAAGAAFKFGVVWPGAHSVAEWEGLARGESGLEFEYGYARVEGKMVELAAEGCGNSDVDLLIDGRDGGERGVYAVTVPVAQLTEPLLAAIREAAAARLDFAGVAD